MKTSSERLLPRLSSGALPLSKDLPSAILLCRHALLLCSPGSVCGYLILYVILQLLIGLTSLYFDWGFFLWGLHSRNEMAVVEACALSALITLSHFFLS